MIPTRIVQHKPHERQCWQRDHLVWHLDLLRLWHLKEKSVAYVFLFQNVYDAENNGGLIRQQSKQPHKTLSKRTSWKEISQNYDPLLFITGFRIMILLYIWLSIDNEQYE